MTNKSQHLTDGNMSFPWFRLKGMVFLPASLIGWLISFAAISYAVYAFFDIDSRSRSMSDTLVNFTFSLIVIGAIYTIVAFATCREPDIE